MRYYFPRLALSVSRILLLLFAVLLTSCAGPAPEAQLDAPALAQKLLEQIDYPEMIDVSARVHRFYAPFTAESFATAQVYLCSNAVRADEIAIFQVKDIKQVAEVKAGLEAHYEAREEEYAGYAPKEADRIKKRFSLVKDSWLIYVISDNYELAEKLVNEALQ